MHGFRRGALDLRVRELERAPEPLHLPGEAHELALGVALLDELPAEPRRAHVRRRAVRGIEKLDLGHELPARGAALADVPEDRLDGLVVVGADAPQRGERGVVEIRPGQVPQEVADAADLEPLEELARIVADAGKTRDREIERALRRLAPSIRRRR